MNTLTMEITPAQAADFLRANIEHNRPVRNLWVRKLAAMIERGEWRMTHQGIALTPDNRLLDGQHRLLAVVLANKAVPMRVTFDCDPDAFAVLDNGVKRAISDQVRITRHAAAVYALLHLIRIRSAQSVAMPTAAQVIEIMSWAAETVENITFAVGNRLRYASAPIVAAVAAHMMDDNEAALAKLSTFVRLDYPAMTPVMHAFLRQINDGKASTKDKFDLMARAWRAFSGRDEHVSKLQVVNAKASIEEMAVIVNRYADARDANKPSKPPVGFVKHAKELPFSDAVRRAAASQSIAH
jgi:hypothetical protein